MLVELCVENYATSNGLVNGVDGIFKTLTSYHNKIIISISFLNPKTWMFTRKKSIHLYTKKFN